MPWGMGGEGGGGGKGGGGMVSGNIFSIEEIKEALIRLCRCSS